MASLESPRKQERLRATLCAICAKKAPPVPDSGEEKLLLGANSFFEVFRPEFFRGELPAVLLSYWGCDT